MKWPHLLIILYFYLCSSLSAQELDLDGPHLRDAISGFNRVVTHATEPLANCDQGRLPPEQVIFEKDVDTKKLHQKVDLGLGDGTKLPTGTYEGDELTILTQEEADKLMRAFEEVEYMKFDYLHDGCEIRAHEFALIARANGIEMGKAMTMYGNEISSGGLYPKEWTRLAEQGAQDKIPVPEGFVGWRYHVAPYVLVQDGDEVRPYVFDIGIAKKPKTLSQWNQTLTNATREKTRTFVKDRAYIHPLDNAPRKEESHIGTELNKQELIREMGYFEFEYWDQKGLLVY